MSLIQIPKRITPTAVRYGAVTANTSDRVPCDTTAYASTVSATTSASPTVTDATASAAWAGRPVTGAGIPANTYVGTVTAGVSYTLVSSTGAPVNATATAAGVTVAIGGTFVVTTAAAAALAVGSSISVLWKAGTTPPTITAGAGITLVYVSPLATVGDVVDFQLQADGVTLQQI